MSESLAEVKARLAQKYMGKCGVHGVGMSRSHQAIKLYVGPDSEIESSGAILEVQQEALPWRVIVVREEPPELRPASTQNVV